MERFVFFGPDHLLALLAIVTAVSSLMWWTHRVPKAARIIRPALVLVLATLAALSLVWLRSRGVSWLSLAPLHLCDAAILVAIWALLTLRPLACELTYYWGASGTVLAVLTPDVAVGFPAPEFLMYFGLHGAVIATALLVPYGIGVRPRPGSVWRAFLATNVYAAAVALINFATGANFMYLREKPSQPTPLDWFGPWPWYLLVAEVVALGLLFLLSLPFRRAASR